LLFYKKQETQQVNLILYLIIETREVLSTYTLLPHLIRILNIFGRFPALLFFIKKISEDFFIYGNERWGGGDKTCKIRKKQKTKRKNVHVQFEEKNEDFGKPEFTWEPFFLSKAAFWLIGRRMAAGGCDMCEFISRLPTKYE